MERKLNNKGLSLVELVIAIGMSTIVMGAAAMFLYNADKSYHAAEFSIDVQMEAQIVMEQLGNWVMESNRIYLKDNNVLVLYSIPRNNGKNVTNLYPVGFRNDTQNEAAAKASRRVIFSSGTKLYMVKTDGIANAEEEFKRLVDPQPGDPDVELYTSADILDENCICDFLVPVTDPSISTFKVAKSPADADDANISSISVSLTLKEGTRDFPESYTITNIFSSRNGLFGSFVMPSATPAPAGP